MSRSTPTILQEPRLARRAAIALLLAACATSHHTRERVPPGPPAVPPPPAAAPAEPARGPITEGWVRYVVQPGDTLGRIAGCRGVALETLAEANGIRDPRRIVAGSPLRVPPHDRCSRTQVARAKPPAATSEARAEALARGRQRLDAARARYDAADFDAALKGAEDAARALQSEKGSPAADPLLARCHALAALAAAGLEERDRAISEFRLAFALDPGLKLSPEDASPRIQELVAAARRPPSQAAH